MRMVCSFLVLLLCPMFLMQNAFADMPVYARLVMPLFFESEIPEDIDQIKKEVNKITQEKIGASVELIPLLYLYGTTDPLRVSELEMLTKEGIIMDIYPSIVQSMEPIALDNLLEQYGKDILALVGEFRLTYYRTTGPLYQIGSINNYAASVGVTMRKDVVEKYGLDLSDIHSLADLDPLFAFIIEREPGLKMICSYQTQYTLLSRFKHAQAVPRSFLDVSSVDGAEIINYYATDVYREAVYLMRKWFEAGYIPEDFVFQNIRASTLVNAGELFAYLCAWKPGIDFEQSQSCGMEMITVCVQEPIVTRYSLDITQWCISATCKNPGKAMQFLNLLYTDSELVNLLVYGIEDIHYIILEDGTIDFPEGVTAETVGYQNTLAWLLPNQSVSHVWTGNDPQVWEKLRIYNESAPVSTTLNFSFDPSKVASEYANVNAIAGKYNYGLETGQLDPDIYLPMMLSEMEAAGAARVMEEAQAQYNAFLLERD